MGAAAAQLLGDIQGSRHDRAAECIHRQRSDRAGGVKETINLNNPQIASPQRRHGTGRVVALQINIGVEVAIILPGKDGIPIAVQRHPRLGLIILANIGIHSHVAGQPLFGPGTIQLLRVNIEPA